MPAVRRGTMPALGLLRGDAADVMRLRGKTCQSTGAIGDNTAQRNVTWQASCSRESEARGVAAAHCRWQACPAFARAIAELRKRQIGQNHGYSGRPLRVAAFGYELHSCTADAECVCVGIAHVLRRACHVSLQASGIASACAVCSKLRHSVAGSDLLLLEG